MDAKTSSETNINLSPRSSTGGERIWNLQWLFWGCELKNPTSTLAGTNKTDSLQEPNNGSFQNDHIAPLFEMSFTQIVLTKNLRQKTFGPVLSVGTFYFKVAELEVSEVSF